MLPTSFLQPVPCSQPTSLPSLIGLFLFMPPSGYTKRARVLFGSEAWDTAAQGMGPSVGAEILMHMGNGGDQQTLGDQSVDALLCRARPEVPGEGRRLSLSLLLPGSPFGA